MNDDEKPAPKKGRRPITPEFDELTKKAMRLSATLSADGPLGMREPPITETVDPTSQGESSRVTHSGGDPAVHKLMLIEHSNIERIRITEGNRTARFTLGIAGTFFLAAIAFFAFGGGGTNAYVGAALLLLASGVVGVRWFRFKIPGVEFQVGRDGGPGATKKLNPSKNLPKKNQPKK